MWRYAEVTGIVPVSTVQGILETGYWTYTASYGYAPDTASVVFNQDGTLQEAR